MFIANSLVVVVDDDDCYYGGDAIIGLEHEINAGIMAADSTPTSYSMCFVRHIEDISYNLQDPLAPQYVDVIEVNYTRTIERAKTDRLNQVKVCG